MTNEGKSTLGDALIRYARVEYPQQEILVYDTKPCYRAEKELNGVPCSVLRYRNWDTDKGVLFKDSVLIAPPGPPGPQIDFARQQHYKLLIVQTEDYIAHGKWMAEAMEYAYRTKKRNVKQLHVVDETNHWFRVKRTHGNVVIRILTSGRENGVGMLLGGQRPRNISVEAVESCTNLYWFHTPYREDVIHLRAMGVPDTARPGQSGSHVFYFYSRIHGGHGWYKLPEPGPGERGYKNGSRGGR